jgi:hypothetical protein
VKEAIYSTEPTISADVSAWHCGLYPTNRKGSTMTIAAELDTHFTEISKNGISLHELNDLIAKYPKADMELIDDDMVIVTFSDKSKIGLDLRSSPYTWWIPKSQLN